MTSASGVGLRPLGGVVLLAQASWGCSAELGRERRIAETTLRSSVIRIIQPTYPAQSIADRSEGVAVADLELAGNGSVRTVTMLESPDSEIAREITTVLKQWRFSITGAAGGKADPQVRGKVTHYFVLDGAVGLVLSPNEQAVRMQRAAR